MIQAYERYRLLDRRLAMPVRRYENGVKQMVWLCQVTNTNCPPPMLTQTYNDVIPEQTLLQAVKV